MVSPHHPRHEFMNEHHMGSLGRAPQGKFSSQELDRPYFLLVHQFLGKVGEPSRIRRSLKRKKCMHT